MKKAALAMTVLAFCTAPLFAETYSFKIKNGTNKTITTVAAAATTGETGTFNIGNGIAPGEERTIEWAEHTNDSPCEWHMAIGFEDGSSTDAVPFDFCTEPELVVQ